MVTHRTPTTDSDRKAAALDAAFAHIDKQYGKGAVMRLGDKERVATEVIPTSSLALDIALGVGGIPRGRVVEIYGPESSGKCVTVDTVIPTSWGLLTMGEIIDMCGETVDGEQRVVDVSERELYTLNEYGDMEQVSALTFNGVSTIVRITTLTGRTVTVTPNHPIRVIRENGVAEWVESQNIVPGDTVVNVLGGAHEFPETGAVAHPVSTREAELVGYLMGAQCRRNFNGVHVTTQSRHALETFKFFLGGVYLDETDIVSDKFGEYVITSRHDNLAVYTERVLTMTFDGEGKPNSVPKRVRQAPPTQQRVFFRALAEEASNITFTPDSVPPPAVEFYVPNDTVSEHILLMLSALGFHAQREYADLYHMWEVSLPPEATAEFLSFLSGATPPPAAVALEPLRILDTVDSVIIEEPRMTYDLFVPGTHSFVAGGLAVHNTTLALHVIANAQKGGGTVAFIDAEHALDPSYAENLGVDTDKLIVSQPDNGEQALEIADTLIRSGALDLIVIDSVAALVPRAELEGEMGQSHVGLQARLMSQALRKITGELNSTNTTAIFINQLREKVGVMFGCFHHDTPITLADGSSEKIGTIVTKKRPVEVLSYNPDTGTVEPRKVTNWFNNGDADTFLRFTVDHRPASHLPTPQFSQFTATPNHAISTPDGWENAENLTVGSDVLVPMEVALSPEQHAIVMGFLLGNATLTQEGLSTTAQLNIPLTDTQTYHDWKVSLLSNIAHTQSSQQTRFLPLEELYRTYRDMYTHQPTPPTPCPTNVKLAGNNTGKHFSFDALNDLPTEAWALWYMDNGTLHQDGEKFYTTIDVSQLSPGTRHRLAITLHTKFGVESELKPNINVLTLNQDNTHVFFNTIYQHIHPSKTHFLTPPFQGHYVNKVVPRITPHLTTRPATILTITTMPPTGNNTRYDIEVEHNHNYFAGNTLVHNSPETTSGGRALKFYASVRLDIRRIESLKDGTTIVANRTRVKVVKNKVAPPFRQAEFDIVFGQGISREGDIIDLGVLHSVVKKSGAWYTYEGDQLGQGKEKVRQFLRDNPELANEIEQKILTKVGLLPDTETNTPDISSPANKTHEKDTLHVPDIHPNLN